MGPNSRSKSGIAIFPWRSGLVDSGSNRHYRTRKPGNGGIPPRCPGWDPTARAIAASKFFPGEAVWSPAPLRLSTGPANLVTVVYPLDLRDGTQQQEQERHRNFSLAKRSGRQRL